MSRVWLIVAAGVAGLAALLYWLAGERPDALAAQGDQVRLVYLVLLLVLVASGLLAHWRARPGLAWLRHGLIWAGVGLLLVVGYSFRFELNGLWTRTLAELMPGRAIEVQTGTVIVRAGEDRHFYVDAMVDGAPVRLLVDTGASTVTLTRADARRIGFDLEKLRYTVPTETANGVGFGAPVRLREIRVGPIVVRDVRAMVNQAPMSASLLGMSFLGRLSGYTVEGGTLTLVRQGESSDRDRNMVRLDKIYTRGGDQGMTSLGDGARLHKDAPRIRAIGAVDEANAAIGFARAPGAGAAAFADALGRVQNDLFDLGADLARPGADAGDGRLRIRPEQVVRIESEIDALNAELAPLTSFVLPGGSEAAARLHLARTAVRRAERAVAALGREEPVNPSAFAYLNRLSDLLFVMARAANDQGRADVTWVPGANLEGK